ncbi:ATP-binding protein [Putridiphycobacter roseus]|uniref:ATP-binding protein n=1 Tax=Putridiphycobacter roseus TaxID=2219161 RepID=A0A2W1N9L3_9FLAO|nr:ATP-binding protein [Putridiphycobacter roseus]PZE15955.1 ATP-binding protein [Putridiphycobacter roseus]
MNSPFTYGSTVSDISFTNREDESAKLYQNLTQGINTTIISPRRWGKSSLVEKVIKDINKKEKKTKTVIIDLFAFASEEAFLEIFAQEVIKASSSKWEDWVKSGKTFFKNIIPKVSFGIDPDTDFSLSFDWDEIQKHKTEILNLPETIAIKKDIQLIICLDEFQNLATYKNFAVFEKQMRANWQRHKHVTYCLYGSKQHMMTDIFNNPSKPFYRFGDIMILPKIKTESWTKFIQMGFRKTGKKISKKNASLIANMMQNHSWYVQQLAHYTWLKTQDIASEAEIMKSLIELIGANSPLYQMEVENLSTTQVNLLKAVLKGEKKFTAAKVMEQYRLGTPRNVSKNKLTLLKSDIIHEIDGQFELLDPAFELWFKQNYFKQNYKLYAQ